MSANQKTGGGRTPWPRFIAMVATSSLGSFNENFFKEAAMLVAIEAGKGYLQGYGTMVFTLPFLLFAAPAGWLADRFPKGRVIIGVKLFEVFAMSIGAYGLYTGNWTLIFIMASLMATQSVISSPAMNGFIPELFPEDIVTKANAIMTVLVLCAILAGVAGAGFTLGWKGCLWSGAPHGRRLVMLIAIATTVAGFFSSLGVPRFPAAYGKKKFPWQGPVDTLKALHSISLDRLMAITVAVNVLTYALGSLQIQIINQLGLWQLHAGETMTGLMIVAELTGFGAGGFVSNILARGARWYRVLWPGMAFMAASMCLIAFVPLLPVRWRMNILFVLFFAAGAGGGMLLVACKSFIQVRAADATRGTVLAAVNFAIYAGILLSGPAANFLNADITPTTSYGILGLVSLLSAVTLFFLLGKFRFA
ncbi:MAG: MFS transporter [Nitrospiraceae bacterium]|nr:MFS transporter [Nitrospiraceae bacterium]